MAKESSHTRLAFLYINNENSWARLVSLEVFWMRDTALQIKWFEYWIEFREIILIKKLNLPFSSNEKFIIGIALHTIHSAAWNDGTFVDHKKCSKEATKIDFHLCRLPVFSSLNGERVLYPPTCFSHDTLLHAWLDIPSHLGMLKCPLFFLSWTLKPFSFWQEEEIYRTECTKFYKYTDKLNCKVVNCLPLFYLLHSSSPTLPILICPVVFHAYALVVWCPEQAYTPFLSPMSQILTCFVFTLSDRCCLLRELLVVGMAVEGIIL